MMSSFARYPYFGGMNIYGMRKFLKEFREVNNMSFDELAYETKISRATLSRIERGEANPTSKTVDLLNNYILKLILEKHEGRDIILEGIEPEPFDDIFLALKQYLERFQFGLDVEPDKSSFFVVDPNGSKIPLTKADIYSLDFSLGSRLGNYLSWIAQNVGVKFEYTIPGISVDPDQAKLTIEAFRKQEEDNASIPGQNK